MVSVSLVALGPLNMPVVVIRSMRAFRIARIFRRIGVIRAHTRAHARVCSRAQTNSRVHAQIQSFTRDLDVFECALEHSRTALPWSSE